MQTIIVKFLLDNHANDEAWYQVVVNGKDTFAASIPLTQKASGPSSPEKRIREWLLKSPYQTTEQKCTSRVTRSTPATSRQSRVRHNAVRIWTKASQDRPIRDVRQRGRIGV